MNGTRIHAAGGVEDSMTAEPKPVSKRKTPDESNPLLAAAAKRARKETKLGATKRKHIGEEQPGGLIIVRAQPQRPSSSQNMPSSQLVTTNTSRPPSSLSQPLPSTSTSALPGHSKPPSKKFKADSSRAPTSANPRDVIATAREEPEVEEDVRQMESETDRLRSRSRAKDTLNASFQFAPSTPKSSSQRHMGDELQPLPQSETPQIERNKLMREGSSLPTQRVSQTPPTRTPQHSRRSSLSMRGKRISTSFENTGVITQPHASVNDSSFYKHIDYDLPESQRLRQLLVWSAARAMTRTPGAASSSSTKPSKPPSERSSSSRGKDPPPLDDHLKRILKTVQEDFIRMLAEKKIDTSVYGGGDGKASDHLKPNEQNVKNRAREVTFQQHINRAQVEAEAWSRVDQFYHTYAMNSKADLEKRRQALKPPLSAKAKGKQRATSQEPSDDWTWLLPREGDLSDDFQEKINLDLVKQIMSIEPHPGSEYRDALDQDMADLEFKLDSLYSYVHSAVQMANTAEAELDHRFSLLSLALSSRSHSLPPPPPSASNTLSSHLPLLRRGVSHPPGESPRDILRALSRIDRERPPGKIGDAARRAVREVQRVQEMGTGGVGERRITGLAPGVGTTPRKVPGTPRRRDR
ncbi:Mis12-Mtw1 protein family-domain-containing protein [Phlebopus sp. FC_14]|nr:Mis12-Mtw1 protein family-domain-containing protein [Phlebopus sp. FC_14]